MSVHKGTNPLSVKSAHKEVDRRAKLGQVFEVRQYRFTRTLSQNNYFHLCVDFYAAQVGDSAEDAKDDILWELGYTEYRKGRERVRRTSLMTVEEMSGLISRFKNYVSNNCDFDLPDAERYCKDETYQAGVKNEINQHQAYIDGKHKEA